ncbi:solute:Na+ symporter, SSS family [Bhargavaea ginsengi]|uniref:Solute:Na+ symporter, SSS family n=1 Tax=Bhargavaea ginsengi TaxID=426757 RepID=A0A1H6UBG4_9BACL|nr:sodium:solute symporter family protein [Bhargavaea ginsengi]SEI89651.1 solute:Na+ symporter, SSS family [Bhargavaea ginsengi]
MSQAAITIIVLVIFLAILLLISNFASKENAATPSDFFLANRGLGTIVMTMTTGASYFSTWTLLGAIGSHYRDGVWFAAFAAWAVVHALFIWLFGSRIWYLGRKHNFITPGDMMEKYFKSPGLRLLFAIVGIVGLVPYMLIQITGGAFALNSLTDNEIPYWVGVMIMGAFVGIIVTLSGGRGAAWSDTFMGFFFGTVLVLITVIFVSRSGGFEAFNSLQATAPDILVNKGNFWGIAETALGLGFGFWIMPHMWQKFYSAKSPMILAKTSIITPFWNSWLMALSALFIGMLAHTPGLVPGLTTETSDRIIPLFFSSYAPLFGSVVVAAVIAAGISTVNSALLSSASLLVNDLVVRFMKKDVSLAKTTFIAKATVLFMTLLIIVISFIPAAQGFLVPVAALGYGIVLQLVPAALGPLYWQRGTKMGAIASIIVGEATLTLIYLFGSPLPLGPATSGLFLGLLTFVIVSLATQDQDDTVKSEFHDDLKKVYFPESIEEDYSIEKKGVGPVGNETTI